MEQRLGSKLKRSAERRYAEEAQNGQRQGPQGAALRHGFGGQHSQQQSKASRRQQQAQLHAGAAAQRRRDAEKEEEESEEEEGRSNAFGKGKQRQVTFNRSDLLKLSEAVHGKKRKRKKSGSAAAQPGKT